MLVDDLAEGRRDVASAISEAIEALWVIRVILLLPLDIIDDLDLILVQLRDVLSCSEALASSSIHLEQSLLIIEVAKALNDFIELYLRNARRVNKHPD